MGIKLKVVFQGGGANLVTLMAAASALEELRDDSEVELVELIGVSAGAIVACMLATETRISSYRGRISDIADQYLPHFQVDIKDEPQGFFKKTKKHKKQIDLFMKIINGEAIFDEAKLKEFFHKIFVDQEKKAERLEDLTIPTTIVAADLSNHEKLSYETNNNGRKTVVDALTDSCALPFAFRTHKTGSVVDGGIANNFPIEDILKDGDEAFVLGFSFNSSPNFGSENALQYAASLLTTSIDSSVKENIVRIEKIGGEVCPLQRNYGLVEFEKAVKDGLPLAKFETQRKAIKVDLEKCIKRLKSKITTEESIDDVRNKILSVHNALDAHEPKVRNTTSMLFGESFLSDATETTQDRSVTNITMLPKGDTIRVLSTGINAGSTPLASSATAWTIESEAGDTLEATQILVHDRRNTPEGAEVVRKALFFLKEPFAKEDNNNLRLVEQKRGDFLGILREKGIDYVRHQCLPPHTNKSVAQLLFIPKGYGKVILADLKLNYPLLEKLGVNPTNVDQSSRHWKTGKTMTKEEIKEYIGKNSYPDYDIYGWITSDIKTGYFCGYVVAKTGTDAAEGLIRNNT